MRLLLSLFSVAALLIAGCGGDTPELPPERPLGANEVSCPDLWPEPDDDFDVDLAPDVINAPDPEFPSALAAAGAEDTVWVRSLIDCNGEVADVVLLESSNVQAIDNAAIEAAARAEFFPAVKDGKVVAAWISVPYTFVPVGND